MNKRVILAAVPYAGNSWVTNCLMTMGCLADYGEGVGKTAWIKSDRNKIADSNMVDFGGSSAYQLKEKYAHWSYINPFLNLDEKYCFYDGFEGERMQNALFGEKHCENISDAELATARYQFCKNLTMETRSKWRITLKDLPLLRRVKIALLTDAPKRLVDMWKSVKSRV